MRALAGKILATGMAFQLLAGVAAKAGEDAVNTSARNRSGSASVRILQAQPVSPDPTLAPDLAAPRPAAPGDAGMGGTAAGAQGAGGTDLPTVVQPGQPGAAIPPVAEIPKPLHGSMSFEAGSGKILTLTLPAANIYVADPKVAEVRPASATSLFVFGVGAGRTTIAAVDAYGRLLADYQIMVHPSAYSAREAQAAIARVLPGSQVQVKPQGKGMMLTGAVATAGDAAQAMAIARGIGGDGLTVDNEMTIASPSQVTLMVRIAQMNRSIARTMGIDWSAIGFFGKVAGANSNLLGTTLGSPACGGVTVSSASINGSFKGPCFSAILNALAKDGLAHIIAEPNLTVVSGQNASFTAGGEFPIPVQGPNATVTVAYKQYGVLLNFLPTVLADGRINLHVKPEVSSLDNTNSFGITAGTATLAVNALKVSRAETTVEMGSGESLAIAGLLQTTSGDEGSGLPVLGDAPVIGSLFKTNNLTREEIELVIIVTPILVQPVKNVAQLQLPAEGYKLPNDVDRLLLMHQVPNADGTAAARPTRSAGFIVR